jgi:hypothetical protein
MMIRRILVALLSLVALVLILGPATVAAMALVRGELEAALYAIGPLLLLPAGFLVVGLVSSLRHGREHPTPFSR